MRQGRGRGFTAAEKTELWDRWQRGEPLKGIGRAFGKPSSSIYFQLAPFALLDTGKRGYHPSKDKSDRPAKDDQGSPGH